MASLAIRWLLSTQIVDRQYYEVFLSGNGEYAYASPYLAGPLVRSTDSGKSYADSTLSPNSFWAGVAVSFTGQYVLAGGFPGLVLISKDYGLSWEQTILSKQWWSSMAISDSGQYIIATAEEYGIGLSNDFGVSWNLSFSVAGQVIVSADGRYATGRGSIVGTDTFVYYSSDHGQTWLNTTEKILGKQCGDMWYGWEYKAYGNTEYGRTFFTAPLEVTDQGNFSWTSRSFAADNDNENVYCDYTGQYVFFSSHATGVSYSADYGYTWHRSEGNYDKNVYTMSVDRNATRIATANYNSWELYHGNITQWYNPHAPSKLPSSFPTAQPTQPTSQPSSTPSAQPSSQPSNTPSSVPTSQPTCGGGSSGQANNTLCTPCEPGTYSPPFQTHCTACPVGTYSPSCGASECTPCEYPLTTLSDGQSSCTAVNVNMGVLPISFILAAGVFVVFVCIATGRQIWIQIALNFMYPTLDVFSDIAYLLTNDFYSIQMFVACILFIVFPVPWFINTLVQRRAVPHLWVPINRVLWLRADREDDFIYYAVFPCFDNGRFPLLSVAKHTSLRTVASELLVWIIAIVTQSVCILVWLIILPVNCLFLLAWLLLGMFFYLTKCIAIGPVWNMWFCVWTGGSDHSTDVTIDTEELNICLQHEFYFETLPQFCLQLINNMYLGKLTSVAIFSFVWSLYTALNGLWKFVYYRYCLDERKEMRDIPIDKSLRIRLKWLNIDWVLVDAKLTPQSKDKPVGRAGGRITRSTKLNSRTVMCGDDGFFDTTIEESLVGHYMNSNNDDDVEGFINRNSAANKICDGNNNDNSSGTKSSYSSASSGRTHMQSRSSRRDVYSALPSESFYSQPESAARIGYSNTNSSDQYTYSPVYTTAAVMITDGEDSTHLTVHTVQPELSFEQWLQTALRQQGVSEFHAAQCYNVFKHECITSVAVWAALPETVFDRDYLSAVGITQVGLQQHLLKLHSVIR